MQFALVCLDAVSLAALLLLAGRAVARPRRPESWLIVALCAAVSAHVILARVDYAPWIPPAYRVAVGPFGPALDILRNTTPGLLALLASRAFADHRRPPAWLLGLLLLQVGLEAAPHVVGGGEALDAASAVLQLVLVFLALVWTVGFWRVDLIAARRRSRAVMAILLSVDGMASSVLLRLVIPRDSQANYLVHVALTLFTAAVLVLVTVRAMNGDIGPYLGAEAKAPPGPGGMQAGEDALILARLSRLMDEERAYLQPRLSLGELARKVGAPEYRLRRVIHERLGFRNFNAFLHSHRIRLAAEQLADPALRRTPILTIALSCGYDSPSTFSRGFREVMGRTPSDYRSARLGQAPESA